ncbi:MAG TPA: hydroxymethylglutaryl-CoA synthase [Patescibacteria group bacterium]|nr:hydroxymethylglutaryl-CoA synthase [Patescibacteria group bacterium]
MIGIVSYGFYVPKFRIKIDDIASVWGKNPEDIKRSLVINEKAVAGLDEDSLTMGFEASSMALSGLKIDRNDIGSVLFGSETPPYSVNPASTILGEFLGIGNNYLASDTQFACKAATGAIITTIGQIASGATSLGLVCGSDKANAATHDALEYTAASGSVALLLGQENLILEILGFHSYSSDTPDFWRREGIRYPSHGGRFTGKPSYFRHIKEATSKVLEKTKLVPSDFAHAIFHMPNGKFPREIAREMGFSESQIETSLVVSMLGNSYTASALMGLASVLEVAKPGQLILMSSYGSGAGSDSFVFRVTKNIDSRRREFKKSILKKEYIDYSTYLKFMNII